MTSAISDRAFLCTILLIAGCWCLPVFSRGSRGTSSGGASTGHFTEKTSGDTLDVQVLPGGKVKLHLFAYWPSEHPSPQDFPNGPNMGETETTLPVTKGIAVYTTTEFGSSCKITFKFAGKSVLVEQDGDPNFCGYGMNVNATGTYTLGGKPSPKKSGGRRH